MSEEVLRFEDGPGGLKRAVISGPEASGMIYLHGAHVAEWTPRGERPVLYMSSRSKFESGSPIRGGVPIAFPWFGPRSDGGAGPMHGLARITEWTVESTSLRSDGAVEIVLTVAIETYSLRFRAAFGKSLEMELEVRNSSSGPVKFEEALHTYFSVGDIHQVSIAGLEGSTLIDKTDGLARKVCSGPVRFAKETDQVHVNTTATCRILDASWNRTIVVGKSGSNATVVWNPWIEKNRNLADMAPDDWRNMVCVETVNALENAVQLHAGTVHRMATAIRVQPGE
jgi:glucose-6-phosphate 1-epimerase